MNSVKTLFTYSEIVPYIVYLAVTHAIKGSLELDEVLLQSQAL